MIVFQLVLFRDFQDVLTCFRVFCFGVLKLFDVVPGFMLLFFQGLVGPVQGSSGLLLDVCFEVCLFLDFLLFLLKGLMESKSFRIPRAPNTF